MNGPDELLDALRSGDRSALSRAITLVESSRASDRFLALELLEACSPRGEGSLRLGITGIPGVGKSTLIDVLGIALIDEGHRVAVLAVDPSSERTGGSILGDKTRMTRLSVHGEAFIRPTATGGTLGGVARRTREAIVLCEEAGYDRILVETVGIGQSELNVDRMTDLNVLLMIAGAGDELQGIKRGIMESADLVAFTKAEGEGGPLAERAGRELRNAISLLPPRDSGRQPEVLLTSGLTGEGIAPLSGRIEALHKDDRLNGRYIRRRKEQALHWLREASEEALLLLLRNDPNIARTMDHLEKEVMEGTISPLKAAEQLVQQFRIGDGPLP